jgi:hypothetical protein
MQTRIPTRVLTDPMTHMPMYLWAFPNHRVVLAQINSAEQPGTWQSGTWWKVELGTGDQYHWTIPSPAPQCTVMDPNKLEATFRDVAAMDPPTQEELNHV